MKKWKTKEGKLIPYNEIEDSHLLNILGYIQRYAVNGLREVFGGVSEDSEDYWMDDEIIFGQDVLDHFDYDTLYKEAVTRGLTPPTEEEKADRIANAMSDHLSGNYGEQESN